MWYSLVRLFYCYDLKCYPILRLNLKIKLKFSRIHLLYIHLILRLVERPVLILTSLNWFFGSFLKFKISKRPRPQPSLASGFLLVFDTGHWNTICTSTHSSSYISFLYSDGKSGLIQFFSLIFTDCNCNHNWIWQDLKKPV